MNGMVQIIPVIFSASCTHLHHITNYLMLHINARLHKSKMLKKIEDN